MKTTSNDSSPSSTSPEAQATPTKSPQLVPKHQQLLEVVDLFRQRDLWRALEEVLRQEQLYHLREAALSSSEFVEYHRHVAQWLEAVLNGALESYNEEAKLATMSESARAKTLLELVGSASTMEPDSGTDYLND